MAGTGKEMRRLMLAVSLSVLALILAVIAYFLADVTVTTNRNISHNRERMIQESVRTLQETQSILILSKFDPSYIQIFNQDLVKRILSGDMDSLYDFAVQVATAFYPIDYVSIIKDGWSSLTGPVAAWTSIPRTCPLPRLRAGIRCWTGWVAARDSSYPCSTSST